MLVSFITHEVKDAVVEFFSGAWDAMKSFGSVLYDTFVAPFEKFFGAIPELWDTFKDGIGNVAGMFSELGGRIYDAIFGSVRRAWTAAKGFLSDLPLVGGLFEGDVQELPAESAAPAISASVGEMVRSTNTVKCDRIVAGANLIATGQSSSTGQLASFDTDGMLVKKTATVGSATTPVYLDAGVPTACSGASLVAAGYNAKVHIPTKTQVSCTSGDYDKSGNSLIHFYDPAKDYWANCASVITSTTGEITTELVAGLSESDYDKLRSVDTLRIVNISRTGNVGSIMGYFCPYPYVSGYPYYCGAQLSDISGLQKGVKPSACTKAVYTLSSIFPDFTSAVGGAQCLYTGDKNIHAFFEGGTLSFTADSFGDFAKNAQYFFHIPLVFPSAT